MILFYLLLLCNKKTFSSFHMGADFGSGNGIEFMFIESFSLTNWKEDDKKSMHEVLWCCIF